MKRLFLFTLFLLCSNIIFSQTWVEQTSGVGATVLYSVSAPDDHDVWVCGAAGTVVRTINGGTNWVILNTAPIPSTLDLYNIFGIDSITALVTGSSATATFVYRTSNGGANWVQVFTQPTGFIDAIWMGNAQAGFMYGDPVGGRWSLWGTITGGLTWDSVQFRLPQAGTETGYNNAFLFDNVAQAVWFGTNNTRIYRSTNLIIWSTQVTTGQTNSFALWFTSSTKGMMGGDAVLLTTNSGASWGATTSPMPGTASISGITGIDSLWWVVRQASQVYFTANNGINWSTQYTAPSGNYYHITKSRGGIPTLYAIRSNGGISKATNLLVGISPVSSEVPEKYSLNQNYPNPFNPSTTLRYSIPVSGNVNLAVYDELGREVQTLVNAKQFAGTYEIQCDGTSYASGIYYYKLQSGNFVETKKMTMVK